MSTHTNIRFLSLGALFTLFAVLFQSAPIFLPFIGLTLSPFSTAPIAIASAISAPLGLLVYVSSIIILLMVHVQEALIFLCSTGILGLMVGGLRWQNTILVVLCTNVVLMIGIFLLCLLVGLQLQSSDWFTPILCLFSMTYTSVWQWLFKHRLSRWVGQGRMFLNN